MKYIPRWVKYALAKKIAFTIFQIRSISNFYIFDRFLLSLLLKLNDTNNIKRVISDHREEVDYCRFYEHIERFEALGANANDIRLDFEEGKYQQVLKVNEDLIHKFSDDYLLHDRLARNYIAGGYREKAKHHFSQSLKLQRKQKCFKGKTGLIVLVTMPRSGTGFVSNALVNGYGLKDLSSEIQYVDAWFPEYGVFAFPGYVAHSKFSPMPDGIVTAHAAALKPNLWTLALITDKLIVNFRDPRQALISWVYYMEYIRFTGNISGLMEYQFPDGYFQWSLEKKIDWQIENYFIPVNLEWIKGWLKADEDPEFPCEILFTQHEVLAMNPRKYFQQILSFYGLSEEKFIFPLEPQFKTKTHKRKGATDEWRQVLSREQVQKINEVIQKEWFERFNWPNF